MISINLEECESSKKLRADRARSMSDCAEYIPAESIIIMPTGTVFCVSRFNSCSMPAEIRASLR